GQPLLPGAQRAGGRAVRPDGAPPRGGGGPGRGAALRRPAARHRTGRGDPAAACRRDRPRPGLPGGDQRALRGRGPDAPGHRVPRRRPARDPAPPRAAGRPGLPRRAARGGHPAVRPDDRGRRRVRLPDHHPLLPRGPGPGRRPGGAAGAGRHPPGRRGRRGPRGGVGRAALGADAHRGGPAVRARGGPRPRRPGLQRPLRRLVPGARGGCPVTWRLTNRVLETSILVAAVVVILLSAVLGLPAAGDVPAQVWLLLAVFVVTIALGEIWRVSVLDSRDLAPLAIAASLAMALAFELPGGERVNPHAGLVILAAALASTLGGLVRQRVTGHPLNRDVIALRVLVVTLTVVVFRGLGLGGRTVVEWVIERGDERWLV